MIHPAAKGGGAVGTPRKGESWSLVTTTVTVIIIVTIAITIAVTITTNLAAFQLSIRTYGASSLYNIMLKVKLVGRIQKYAKVNISILHSGSKAQDKGDSRNHDGL